jgi:hypothetical protein
MARILLLQLESLDPQVGQFMPQHLALARIVAFSDWTIHGFEMVFESTEILSATL